MSNATFEDMVAPALKRNRLFKLCLAGLFFTLFVPLFAQDKGKELSANAVLRRAVDGELKAQADDHSHWMYRVKRSDGGKDEGRPVAHWKG